MGLRRFDTQDLVTANSCFFRTAVAADDKKALVQLTNRCNLRCPHCFASAEKDGETLELVDLTEKVIPALSSLGVKKVTLTGGEPFLHPDVVEVCAALVDVGIPVGICTNGVLLEEAQIENLSAIGNIHVNVSLDGFSPDTHGAFRGNKSSFSRTRDNVVRLAGHNLLGGILSTPTRLSQADDYARLVRFAREVKARYVLMNPLSPFGRGVASRELVASDDLMNRVHSAAIEASEGEIEIFPVRFPNNSLPLDECCAQKYMYVFANGDLTFCPYLAFALRDQAAGTYPDFCSIGNVLADSPRTLSRASDATSKTISDIIRHRRSDSCGECALQDKCGMGCIAECVAAGLAVSNVDPALCPEARRSRLP